MNVLEQIPEPRAALLKAAQVLRPGGILVIGTTDLSSSGWKALDAEKANPYWQDLERHHHFSRERLLGWCGSVDLKWWGLAYRLRGEWRFMRCGRTEVRAARAATSCHPTGSGLLVTEYGSPWTDSGGDIPELVNRSGVILGPPWIFDSPVFMQLRAQLGRYVRNGVAESLGNCGRCGSLGEADQKKQQGGLGAGPEQCFHASVPVGLFLLALVLIRSDGGADECLQRLFVDRLALVEIDGAPDVAVEAGIP